MLGITEGDIKERIADAYARSELIRRELQRGNPITVGDITVTIAPLHEGPLTDLEVICELFAVIYI